MRFCVASFRSRDVSSDWLVANARPNGWLIELDWLNGCHDMKLSSGNWSAPIMEKIMEFFPTLPCDGKISIE